MIKTRILKETNALGQERYYLQVKGLLWTWHYLYKEFGRGERAYALSEEDAKKMLKSYCERKEREKKEDKITTTVINVD